MSFLLINGWAFLLSDFLAQPMVPRKRLLLWHTEPKEPSIDRIKESERSMMSFLKTSVWFSCEHGSNTSMGNMKEI